MIAGLSLLSGCNAYRTPGSTESSAFDVGVFGDMPYISSDTVRDEKTQAYHRVLRSAGASDLAFAVHIGDFAAGGQCSDSVYALRRQEFGSFAHPLIYLFGDNEWTDCRAPFTPAERLSALRRIFAAPGSGTLGRRSFPVKRQSENAAFADYSENVRWIRNGVLFVGIHVVGSNNNWGPDSTASAEHRARTNANVQWLRESFTEASRIGAIGVAVFMQANPLPSSAARAARPNGFAAISSALLELSLAFGKPVALVHGDTHYFRVDKPFEESGTFRVHARITRAETFGDPNSHWLRMRVDPGDPDVFSFRPMLVPENITNVR